MRPATIAVLTLAAAAVTTAAVIAAPTRAPAATDDVAALDIPYLAEALKRGSRSARDSAAIRATALDYAEGWYAGDAARMERALHPRLAKRIVRHARGSFELQDMSANDLVGATRAGGGNDTPARRQQKDVAILDIFGDVASVRLTMDGWIDYMHMARWDGRWVIVNVLWELKPS